MIQYLYNVRTAGHGIGHRAGLLLLLSSAAWASPVMAQTVDTPPPTARSSAAPVPAATPSAQNAASDTPLEEIVVTAQRRNENLQNVPISVSAITANTLKTQGVNGIAFLGTVTPGLTLARDTQAPQIYIRGVGTSAVGPGQEGDNAVYIDGIYIATPSAAFLPFNNVERIEVLKGPQGTLFGRNATGGLIQIITRDPSLTATKLDASVGYASYDTFEGQFYGSTPINRSMAIDMSVYYSNQVDGWGKNYYNGQPVYNGHDFAARSKLLWDLGGSTSLKIGLDYAKGSNTFPTRQLAPDTVAAGGFTRVGGYYDSNSDVAYGLSYKSEGVSARFEHSFSWAQLVSLTAYRYDATGYSIDTDSTPLPSFGAAPVVYNTNQFTQELQLQSLASSRIKWIAGLYYFHGGVNLGPVNKFGTAFKALGGFDASYSTQSNPSYAAYAQATVPLGERTNVTVGGRYTIDRKQIAGDDVIASGPRNPFDLHAGWERPTWRFAIDHHFADNAMVYLSYNRGYKSGEFSPFSGNVPVVNPETLDAYEVGGKFELFDRHVRLNVSGYHYNYTNLQLTDRVGTLSVVVNAASAKIDGGEAELVVSPTQGLSLTGGLNILNARYSSFPNAPVTIPSPAICGPVPMPAPGPRTGGNTVCSGNATGNNLSDAPHATLSLGATYEVKTGIGKFSADAHLYHSSTIYFDPDNRNRQDPYNVVNASLRWAPTDRYAVRLWCKNLLNEQYAALISSAIVDTITAAAPRTIGGSFEVHF